MLQALPTAKLLPLGESYPSTKQQATSNIWFEALCNSQASPASPAQRPKPHRLQCQPATHRQHKSAQSPEPRARAQSQHRTAQSRGPCPVDSSASRQPIDNISRLGGMRGAFESAGPISATYGVSNPSGLRCNRSPASRDSIYRVSEIDLSIS